jgi:DNA-binding transcriptional LysR family regulator
MLEQHLEKLRGFFILSQEKTTVLASQKLAVSQPAISKNLRHLEEVLGQALMVRSRHGMILTPAGQKLYSFCETLFTRIEDLEASLGSLDEICGVLKIGTYETFGETIWPHLLGIFSRRYPDLDVQIKTESASELWRELENGSIDMIVDAEPRTNQQYFSKVLFKDRFGIYRKKGAKFRESVTASLPMSYVAAATDRNGKTIKELLRQIDLKHRLVYDVQSFTFVRALVIRGLCIGVLPERLASQHVESGELEPYLADGKKIRFGSHRVCATYPEHMRKNPRINAITGVMVEVLRKPID